MASLALSVLDLIPVRRDQSTAEALAATISLAERADALGFTRYWLAEHHNMPAVAATAPAILVAMVAGRTRSIRVGSGGVMLPNHAPLVVAEQFALLEAAYPGRIDLGIGRAPGSDPVTRALLRAESSGVHDFAENVEHILAMTDPAGSAFRLADGSAYAVRATPAARSAPALWLLGSSDYSARLAARLGLPYVFANHFGGDRLGRALALYRSEFHPSALLGAPQTILTVNAVAAETVAEAHELALPAAQSFARRQSGELPDVLPTVEEACAATLTEVQQEVVDRLLRTWILGEADETRKRISALANRHGIDEVMLVPIAGAHEDAPRDRVPARERTLELLAAV